MVADEHWHGMVSQSLNWADVSRLKESCDYHGVALPNHIQALVTALGG